MQQKDNQHWTTKDGRTLLISEMEDRHLCNTIRMVRRNVEAYRLQFLSSMWNYMEDAPEGAYMACESAEIETEEMNAEQFLDMYIPSYSTMLQEAVRRGLAIEVVPPADVERMHLVASNNYINYLKERLNK